MNREQIEATSGAPVFEWLSGLTVAQVEEGLIRASFARHNGHRGKMIDELGLSRSTLRRKLIALGLRKPRVYLFGRP
jgi:DNA-binding NtrC family response regulator